MQRVYTKRSFSEWGVVYAGCGMPQGSILDPLLFSIYINYVSTFCFHGCQLNLHADDMELHYTLVVICFQHSVAYRVIWILLGFDCRLTS